MGLPKPRASSSLSRLKLVLNGIARARVAAGLPQKPRLPVTVHTLPNSAMLWAACSLCFFGFFRAGEITIPNRVACSQDRHLSWGDLCAESQGASEFSLKSLSVTSLAMASTFTYVVRQNGWPAIPSGGLYGVHKTTHTQFNPLSWVTLVGGARTRPHPVPDVMLPITLTHGLNFTNEFEIAKIRHRFICS